MPPLHQINRRSFLRDLGGGTIAIAVLGLASCTSSDSDGATATTTGEATDSSSASTAESATTTSADGAESEPSDGGLQWERVTLGFVSAYVLARGSELAVVDTGVGGSEAQILGAISTLGGTWDDVAHVILTHSHGDHIGSLGSVLTNATKAKAYAGAADIGSISAPRDLLAVNDGDEVFGLQVVGTPGHTPGHIAVFDEDTGLLVAGDAINESGGSVTGANPSFTPDMETAGQSIDRLAQLDVDTILFGHGNPVSTDASAQLAALAGSS